MQACSSTGDVASGSNAQPESSSTRDISMGSPERSVAPTEATTKKKRRKSKGKKGLISDAQTSKARIRKLVPPRPFPTVPASSSATGPRSAHAEGKNRICITRKTKLGMYLRRCKDIILKDGYKTLYLCAMGAAISHLSRLAVSLPNILPHARESIQTEVRTGSVDVTDEIIPDADDEDIYLQTRTKATLNVIIRIDGGDPEEKQTQEGKGKRVRRGGQKGGSSKKARREPERKQVIYQEMDIDALECAIEE